MKKKFLFTPLSYVWIALLAGVLFLESCNNQLSFKEDPTPVVDAVPTIQDKMLYFPTKDSYFKAIKELGNLNLDDQLEWASKYKFTPLGKGDTFEGTSFYRALLNSDMEVRVENTIIKFNLKGNKIYNIPYDVKLTLSGNLEHDQIKQYLVWDEDSKISANARPRVRWEQNNTYPFIAGPSGTTFRYIHSAREFEDGIAAYIRIDIYMQYYNTNTGGWTTAGETACLTMSGVTYSFAGGPLYSSSVPTTTNCQGTPVATAIIHGAYGSAFYPNFSVSFYYSASSTYYANMPTWTGTVTYGR
jgi:hypothetical protein